MKILDIMKIFDDMKYMILTITMLSFAVAAYSQNGKDIYMKYSGKEDVSAVYISPAMFKMIGRIPDVHLTEGNMNLGPVVKSFEGLYLIDSGNSAVNAELLAEVKKMVSSGKFELMMEAKEDGETMNIYTLNEGDTVRSFVFCAMSGGECTFICIDGKIPKAELENLIASAMAEQ